MPSKLMSKDHFFKNIKIQSFYFVNLVTLFSIILYLLLLDKLRKLKVFVK